MAGEALETMVLPALAASLAAASVALGALELARRRGRRAAAPTGPAPLGPARRLARRVGRRGGRVVPRALRERWRRQLVQAALDATSLEEMLGWQLLALAAAAPLALAGALAGGAGVFGAGLGALAAASPHLWLRAQVRERQRRIARALPFSLDLLTLAVEAGLDFASGLSKVVEKGVAGPLRDELDLVLKMLKLGRTREEALQGLAQRVDLAAVTAFVGALVQADRMGTPLGTVLRAQASQLRAARSLRAEKLAGEAPVKMLLPLVAFIFPTVFMVLFGPLVFELLFAAGD